MPDAAMPSSVLLQLTIDADPSALSQITEYGRLVTRLAGERHGTVVHTDRNTLLLDFPGVAEACLCALDLLDAAPLPVRAAVHRGALEFHGRRVGGEAVQSVASLDAGTPGRLVVSEAVYREVKGIIPELTAEPDRSPEGSSEPRWILRRRKSPDNHGSTAGFEALRRRVLEEIRTTGQRPDYGSVVSRLQSAAGETEAMVEELVSAGLVRRRRNEARPAYKGPAETTVFPRKLKRILKSDADDQTVAEAYEQEFARRLRSERAGLAGHTTSYIGVNAMLFGIWGFTGGFAAAAFPWFLFPLLGWGIGYLSHRAGVSAREREYAEVKGMVAPSREQLSEHRRLWKLRRGFRTHLASSGMTVLLLATINAITWGGFPWAAIPTGFMGVGMLQHWRRTREAIASADFPTPVSTTARGEPDTVTARVATLREQLLGDLEALPEAERPVGSEFRSLLDTYVDQIESLTSARREIDSVIASIPIGELEQSRRRLSQRIEESQEPRLKAEYQRSLEQVDRQRQSYSELTTEREMLDLRSDTALHALTQLRIDLARARTTRERVTDSTLDDVRTRSEELSRYLADLRSAYDELS